jgi:hypothetical protein
VWRLFVDTTGFGLWEVWEVPGVAPVQTGFQTDGYLCLPLAARVIPSNYIPLRSLAPKAIGTVVSAGYNYNLSSRLSLKK